MRTTFDAEINISGKEVTKGNINFLIEEEEEMLKSTEQDIFMLGMSRPKDFRDKAGDEHLTDFDNVYFKVREILESYRESITTLDHLYLFRDSNLDLFRDNNLKENNNI